MSKKFPKFRRILRNVWSYYPKINNFTYKQSTLLKRLFRYSTLLHYAIRFTHICSPATFTPEKHYPVPLVQVLVWDPGPVYTLSQEEISHSYHESESNSSFVQALACYYTDWAPPGSMKSNTTLPAQRGLGYVILKACDQTVALTWYTFSIFLVAPCFLLSSRPPYHNRFHTISASKQLCLLNKTRRQKMSNTCFRLQWTVFQKVQWTVTVICCTPSC